MTQLRVLSTLFTLLVSSIAMGQLEEDPHAIGDTFNGGGTTLTFRDALNPLAKPVPEIDVPVGGGTARLRIADMNKALPQDRIYFTFNHFHNALNVQLTDSSDAFSVNRYTIGYEKTLFSNLFSLELRVPFSGTYEFFDDEFSVQGSNAGNISIVTKHLIARNEFASSVVGLGINLPTGTDVSGHFSNIGYRIQNEAVHILPYWAFLAADERNFFHAFANWDFPTNGNPVSANPVSSESLNIGTLTGQALFSLDASWGRWHYRNDSAPLITGLASIIELHYTTTVTDADEIGTVVDSTLLEFSNGRNRSDVLNLTAGIHLVLNQDSALRVAGVVPLRESPDQDFDSEILMQLVHRFGTSQSRPRPNVRPPLGTWNPFEGILSKVGMLGLNRRYRCQGHCRRCSHGHCNGH